MGASETIARNDRISTTAAATLLLLWVPIRASAQRARRQREEEQTRVHVVDRESARAAAAVKEAARAERSWTRLRDSAPPRFAPV
jgi:hypothetical protein